MAILGSVFALLGRVAGRLLNSALGWATILLFGKVEGRKQVLLLVIALGSLAWVVALVGVALPDVGTFMIALVPVPDFVDETVVRLAMLGLAVLIPPLIGVAAIYLTDEASRPSGGGLVVGVLRGYPFTLVLAATIAILAIVSLARKGRSLYRRWEDAHVPVVVKPGGYEAVLGDIERVLDAAGLAVTATPAPTVLSLPPRLLDAVAGKALGSLVPDRLMLLRGQGLDVLVYPSDVAISGRKEAVARARASIAARLTGSPAYLTVSAEAERIEDAIEELARMASAPHVDAAALEDWLRELDGRIARLTVPFDEWETVYRERLQVERDLLARRLEAPAETSASPAGVSPGLVDRLIGAAGLALVALDVALLLGDRRRRPGAGRRTRALLGR